MKVKIWHRVADRRKSYTLLCGASYMVCHPVKVWWTTVNKNVTCKKCLKVMGGK